jgi:hypothetical protein
LAILGARIVPALGSSHPDWTWSIYFEDPSLALPGFASESKMPLNEPCQVWGSSPDHAASFVILLLFLEALQKKAVGEGSFPGSLAGSGKGSIFQEER